jgi:hypothetical protein
VASKRQEGSSDRTAEPRPAFLHGVCVLEIEQGRRTPGAIAYECGQLPQDDRLADGFFIRPIIFTGINNTNPVAREEIFGPATCSRWNPCSNTSRSARASSSTSNERQMTISSRALVTEMSSRTTVLKSPQQHIPTIPLRGEM